MIKLAQGFKRSGKFIPTGRSSSAIHSSDIIGSTYGSIADLKMTRVVDGNLVKVCTWYDNEMGYANTLVEHVIKTASHL